MYLLNRLSIRSRLIIAIIVPVLITSCIIAFVASMKMKQSGDHQIQRLEENLLTAKKESLKDIVYSVETIVNEAKNSGEYVTQNDLEKAVLNRIRSVNFGNSNYVFAYKKLPDGNLMNLAYRPDPKKEGLVSKSNIELQNLLNNLFDAAENKDFYEYIWPNPATGKEEPKISYSSILDGYGWMIGAGVYINDIGIAVEAAEAKLNREINSALLVIALIAIGVSIISVMIGLFVGKTVTKPLQNAIDTMAEIASGDGDLTQRLPEDGSDELSELGVNFNAFVLKIQTTIRKVGETTYQVASAAEELSRVADETRESVRIQGSETDQIASAINEMAATINQISKSANEVQSHGADADRLSKDGGNTMKASQGIVHNLSDNIMASSEVIESLAAKTNEIQSVLDVIHEVTDQTNLLALNAAIEAARAGEHGRGFAVVADEVRQLARRSDESASQIRDMIDGFISESNKAVEKMKSSKELSDETVDRINHAAGTLNTIGESIESIHDQITQIATGSEQQSQVAEEINKNVVRIVEAAQNSDIGVTQTNESSHELAKLSEELKVLIDQFKT